MLLVQRTLRQCYEAGLYCIVSVCDTKLSWCGTDTRTVCVYNRPGSVSIVPAEWDFSAPDWHFSAGAVPFPRGGVQRLRVYLGGGLRQIHTKTG